jgi:hypothetical protein
MSRNVHCTFLVVCFIVRMFILFYVKISSNYNHFKPKRPVCEAAKKASQKISAWTETLRGPPEDVVN